MAPVRPLLDGLSLLAAYLVLVWVAARGERELGAVADEVLLTLALLFSTLALIAAGLMYAAAVLGGAAIVQAIHAFASAALLSRWRPRSRGRGSRA